MERRDYPVADEIWVTSSKERETFEGIARRRVRVTPNVVEADAHAVFDREVTATAFVGWLAYPPNEAAALEFIRDIVPRVRALGGPQRATVIGRDPGQRLIREADRHDVELTGEVPDTRAAVAAAGLLVAPIRTGGGTRIKLLEAAAIGVPIVATRTAAAGSALVAGRDYANGESADDLARAAVALSRDGEARTRIAAAAWRCVSASHSRSGLDRILAAAVSDLLAKGR
jgi:glycosyltransferase involved in cell wall biosynthesis